MGLFGFFKVRKKKQTSLVVNPTGNVKVQAVGVCDTPLNAKYTPEEISTLGRRDIFVFGYGVRGHHEGSDARIAINRFGALIAGTNGLYGNSYAIPIRYNINEIKPYIDKFIEFAEHVSELTFYVTKIGCEWFDLRIIAPLFRNAYNLPNVILPIEFVICIEKENRSMHPQRIRDTMEAVHEVREKHYEAPIKIIGIGGGGGNSVERMIENPIQGVEYCVINNNKTLLKSKDILKGYLHGISNDPCGIIPWGSTESWFSRYYVTDENKDMVCSIIDDSAKYVVVVAGFGGGIGTFGTKWLVQLCREYHVPVIVVCTIPFDFEGQRKQQRALDVAHELSAEGIDIRILMADDLKHKYSDMSLLDSFSMLDEYVADVIHKICIELLLSKEKVDVNTANGISSRELTTHCYGMTRTFADIILGLNEEKKYTSPDQALSDLGSYMRRFSEQGDNIAFFAIRILQSILHDDSDIFADGHLNVSRLRELVFEDKNFLSAYDKAYDSYCREKLLNLVAYLNEFRRYSKPEELRRDLFENTDVLKFSACAPIHGFYYFVMCGATGMNYPVQFFVRAVRNLWSEITTDGILDADKMRRLMFDNHDEAVNQFGLEATIHRDYIEDSPCHPEVFVPKVMGTAPIYVKDDKTERYIRSCGEGKGPNSIPDWLEFQIAKHILENDKSYKLIGDFYIPKYDSTLPVYGNYSGRLVFRTQAEKLKFIEDVKLGKSVWR